MNISIGHLHTGILYYNGKVELFGFSNYGQINIELLKNENILDLDLGGFHSGVIYKEK